MRGRALCLKGGLVLTSLLSALLPLVSVATTVTVKVTVVAVPCTINDDRAIEVEFGDVMTTRIDGNNYLVPVNYSLSCPEILSNAMKLRVWGSGAAFDGTVLQTDKAGLGIELRQVNGKLAVNHWLNFIYPAKPELWAVPVRQGGLVLSGGEFTASATLQADYQ